MGLTVGARVLLLGDTHIGFDSPRRPRVERRRRGPDFLQNFELALAPALRGEVDFVVHGGDLLFRSRVPPALVEAALAPLVRVAEAGIPVFLVPGNHERSRIDVPLLSRRPLLHVFHRPATFVARAAGLRVAFAGFPYARDVRACFDELLATTGHRSAIADMTLLCMHHCVEGATVGPADFMFRDGADVVRRSSLPPEITAVLSGHIHRHQVLPGRGGRPPVVYAGSVERTSFAEKDETKGYVVLDVSPGRIERVDFSPLPTRPMVERWVDVTGVPPALVVGRVRRALACVPRDAIVRLRLEGAGVEAALATLGAATLRAIAPPDVTVELPPPRAVGRADGGGAEDHLSAMAGRRFVRCSGREQGVHQG